MNKTATIAFVSLGLLAGTTGMLVVCPLTRHRAV